MTNILNNNNAHMVCFAVISFTHFCLVIFFYAIFLLSLTLSCGLDQDDVPACSRIYYFSIISIFPIAIWLGYLITQFAPPSARYFLSSLYNLIFSITLFAYLYGSKISLILSIDFSLFFFMFRRRLFSFYLKYKNR